jgi:hypothetical protein
MASSINFPFPDPIYELDSLIETYRNIPKCNDAIERLCREILGKIERDEASSRRLLARLSVVICPKIKEKCTAVAALTLLFQTAHKEIASRHLIEQTTAKFLAGDFNSKEDIPLLIFMIENHHEGSPLYRDPTAFLENLSPATVCDALSTLMRKNVRFFGSHFSIIFDKLTSLGPIEEIDTKSFFEALSRIPQEIKDQIELLYPAIWLSYRKFEISRKSSVLWECINMEKDPFGIGYRYTFRFRPISKAEEQRIQQQIYPALEMNKDGLFFSTTSIIKEFQELEQKIAYLDVEIARLEVRLDSPKDSLEMIKILDLIRAREAERQELIRGHGIGLQVLDELQFYQELGYQELETGEIIMPDREALTHRYEAYRSGHRDRDLPPIDIIDSEGIASDLAFILENMKHDGVLSNGKEFIHDHIYHVQYVLDRAYLGSKNFNRIKQKMLSAYQFYMNKLDKLKLEVENLGPSLYGFSPLEVEQLKENYPIFLTLVGGFVDTITNQVDALGSYTVDNDARLVIGLLEHHQWINYFEKQYSDHEKGPIFNEALIKALYPVFNRL